MAITKDDILEAVGQMSVMDLNDLVKAFEEKFGVSAAAMAVAGPAAGAGAGALINALTGGSGSSGTSSTGSNAITNAAKQVLSNAVKNQVSKNPAIVKASIDALKNAGATPTSTAATSQVQFKDNGFYSIYERFHADLKSGKIDSTKGITVEKIGGTECQKCHY